MDLDGDGIKDILTGAPNGVCHFFRGEGGGKFAASHLLTHPGDKTIQLGTFSNVAPVDWNGDGILDLVAYSSNGEIALKLMLGKGDLVYDAPQPLLAGGKPFPRSDQKPQSVFDGRVCFADWDGDGTQDLILGRGDGSVTFYKGRRDASGALELTAGESLIEPFSEDDFYHLVTNYKTMELKRPRCGHRPTVSVTDWNGDGQLDLLIGDWFRVAEEDTLTPEVRSREPEVRQQLRELNAETTASLASLNKRGMEAIGKPENTRFNELTREELQRFQRIYAELAAEDKNHQALVNAYEKLAKVVKQYDRSYVNFGYVWVYLRKSSAVPASNQPREMTRRAGFSLDSRIDLKSASSFASFFGP